MQSWSEYFQLSKNYPPSNLLEVAIPAAPARDHALDLGAGSLKDSKFLLSMGFRKVTAIDQSPDIKNFADKIPSSLLKIQIKKLEKLRLPSQQFDLINASYALPFTAPPHLPALIQQIIQALKPQGMFCAQFFGPADSWNTAENQFSFTDRSTLLEFLKPLKILHLVEEQKDASTIDGQPKHWHLFHVIAQKQQSLSKRNKHPNKNT